jgi:hypothetical protein
MLARARNQLPPLLIALTSGCGARLLDLGHDGSRDGSTSGPTSAPPGCIAGAEAVMIASHQYGAGALAMGSGRLFWATEGRGSDGGLGGGDEAPTIRSCDVRNCQATIVSYAKTKYPAQWFGVNRTDVYWSDAIAAPSYPTAPNYPTATALFGCPSTGCARPPTRLSSPCELVWSILLGVDDTSSFWFCEGPQLVWRLPLSGAADGGGVLPWFAALYPTPENSVVQIDAGNVYVAHNFWGGDVIVQAVDGPDASLIIAEQQHDPNSLALDAERIYWTENYEFGSVMACPRAGCQGMPTVLAGYQRYPGRIAVDDKNAYWVNAADANGLGDIVECPLSGCGASPKILASGQQTYGGGLVIDADYVYWTNRGQQTSGPTGPFYDGDVSRVCK